MSKNIEANDHSCFYCVVRIVLIAILFLEIPATVIACALLVFNSRNGFDSNVKLIVLTSVFNVVITAIGVTGVVKRNFSLTISYSVTMTLVLISASAGNMLGHLMDVFGLKILITCLSYYVGLHMNRRPEHNYLAARCLLILLICLQIMLIISGLLVFIPMSQYETRQLLGLAAICILIAVLGLVGTFKHIYLLTMPYAVITSMMLIVLLFIGFFNGNLWVFGVLFSVSLLSYHVATNQMVFDTNNVEFE
ncbi:hypothetical protein HDE_07736 [Halotydeus destructor]|nr:hypothetical protein HDE_07736 [Halotydeus destructor]